MIIVISKILSRTGIGDAERVVSIARMLTDGTVSSSKSS